MLHPIAISPSGVASTPKKETVLSKITGVGIFNKDQTAPTNNT